MRVLAIITVSLVAAAFVAMERERVSSALTEVVMFLVRPLGVLMTWVGGAVTAVVQFIRAQLQEEDTGEAATGQNQAAVSEVAPTAAQHPGAPLMPAPDVYRRHLSRFIGAVLLTVLTVLFGAAEVYLVKLSLAAMLGLPSADDAQFPSAIDWITAAAMLAVTIFWGMVLIDLHGGTRLLPEQFLARFRKPLLVMAWSAVGLSLAAMMVLAVWRGQQVATPVAAAPTQAAATGAIEIPSASGGASMPATSAAAHAPSAVVNDTGAEKAGDGFSRFATIFFPAALAALTALSMLVSFTGVVYLLRYLAVLALAVLMVPLLLVLLPLRILEQLLATLIGFKDRAVELVARVGQATLNTVGPPWRDLRSFLQQRVHQALSGESESTAEIVRATAPSSAGALALGPTPSPHTVAPEPSTDPQPAAPAMQPTQPEPENLRDWNWSWPDGSSPHAEEGAREEEAKP
jgi:hypothetical protein